MAPKSKTDLARQHLETARDDLDTGRDDEAVNALFYSAEAAIDFLSAKHSIDTEKKHWLKSRAAKKLHEDDVLDADYSTVLSERNETRKAVWYSGEEPAMDVEDTYAQVEALVVAAEAEA